MEQKDIIALDPKFDFEKTYKQNYCTLLNVWIGTVQLPRFNVDGVAAKFSYDKPLYCVMYREWQHENSFPLERTSGKVPEYWSSVEKAWKWFEEIKDSCGFENVDKEKAFETAQLYLRMHSRR